MFKETAAEVKTVLLYSTVPIGAWVPWDFQQANWTMDLVGWAPAFPVEPVGTELFGSSSWLQTSVPSSSGGQLIEYAAGATQHVPIDKAAQGFEVEFCNMEKKKIDNNPIHVFKKGRIHKYPPSIRPLGEGQWFATVPKLVKGPYHHGLEQFKQAENAKHVAAYNCIMESGHHSAQDVMEGIGDRDFLPVVFYEACFLVQYMVSRTEGFSADKMDPSLRGFLDFNRKAIRQDIMLLENQIPWQVEKKPFVLDDGYEPPHLLGLLRFYIVGRSSAKRPTKPKIMSSISESVSAIELAEIGIELRANRAATEIIHMGVTYRRGTAALFAELSLPPLSLDDERASFLVNMAALELCTTSNFQEAEDEESAICSYLLLLAMLVDREEDVHELRKRRLLQGGGGLTNKEALEFLTGLQSLPLRGSSCYIRVMEEIEKYRINRPLQIMVHAFIYKHRTAIFTVFSVIGVLVSILGTLLSLKARSVIK
ncbi:hypothetical protein BS78_05G265600 [Paspalum vaginatum]|nr:hypothetical protein BS78_05G265600 [Paspalum vaginatum]